jgi:hypothetical protein
MVAAPINVACSPLAITTHGPSHGRITNWDSRSSSDDITVSATPVLTTAITCHVPQVTSSLISLLKSSLRIGCSFILSGIDESAGVSASWDTMLIGAGGPNAPLYGLGGPE